MALHWNFNDKIGEATIRSMMGDGSLKDNTVYLYQGNAFLIMLNEWEEDDERYWSMYSFFADVDHMKNCLGLSKGTDNIFDRGDYIQLKEIKINKKRYSYTKQLVQALIKAFDQISIVIYSE